MTNFNSRKLLDEKTKLGWARLSAMNKEEWAEFRRDSTKLRKIGQLDEYRHDESGGFADSSSNWQEVPSSFFKPISAMLLSGFTMNLSISIGFL